MPLPLLFHAGGQCVEQYGVLTRRSAPRWRGGEEARETFTRGSAGYLVDRDGYLRKVANDQYRIEYVDLDGDGIRETPGLLLESAATNLVTFSDALGSWTSVGTPTLVTSDGQGVTPQVFGDNLLGDDDAGVIEGKVSPNAAAGTDTSFAFLCLIKKATESTAGSRVMVHGESQGAAWGEGGVVDIAIESWPGGLPQLNFIAGTQVGATERLADGWFLVRAMSGTSGVPDTNVRVHAYPAPNQVSYTGTVRVSGFGIASKPFPASYFKTSGGAGARSADRCEVPFPHAPREMTVYVKFIERQSPNFGDERIVQIGASSGATPRLMVYKASGTQAYGVQHHNGTAFVESTLNLGATWGDLIELRAVLQADGAVQPNGTWNNGAESIGFASAALAMADEWSSPVLANLGAIGPTAVGDSLIIAVRIAPGVRSMAEMRSADVY